MKLTQKPCRQKINGLYFAGEVLDVDGLTGGFNLQIAFSTERLRAKALRNLCWKVINNIAIYNNGLEWNQPISLYSSVYKRVGDILQFELIQIGAYKLDENRRLKASFCTNIKPTCYKKLHPRIKRITGIRQEGLELAPDFAEAMKNFRLVRRRFHAFHLGDDDISILAQNLNFYKFDTKNAAHIRLAAALEALTGTAKTGSACARRWICII